MSIIAIIAVIMLASAVDKAIKRQKAKQAALEKRMAKEREAQLRINARLAKEQEKQAAQLAKHEAELRKQAEKINKLYERVDKCEDDIAHFSELADKYTEQRDAAQKQLDEIRERLCVANGGLDPEAIAHGSMSKWGDTSNCEAYQEKWSIAFDDKKSGKSKTSDIDKMQKKAEQLESKIIRLNNQIYSAEQCVKKASADKFRAERELSA